MTTISVTSGQTSNGVTLSGGDLMIVFAGGSANGTNVLSGGDLVVSAGGTLVNTVVQSGGIENDNGVASGTAVQSGASEVVFSGGSAIRTALAGGHQIVAPGGATKSVDIGNGGFQLVSSGASANATTISSGGTQEIQDGSALDTIVSGGTQIVDGGSADGTRVDTGLMNVGISGTAKNTTVVSGSMTNSGIAIGTTISKGGAESVIGTDSGTLVRSGGTQSVTGTTISTILLGGGTQIVNVGGKASGTTVSSNANVIVSGAGATTIGSVVLSGGREVLSGGGTASGTTVSAGGVQTVASGGTSHDTTVLGDPTITAPLKVDSQGFQIVTSGGTTFGTTISGPGIQRLDTGGVATATTVSSGGEQFVNGGKSVSTTVLSGGRESVDFIFGGTAISTTVDDFGSVTVGSGGVTSFTTVSSGGFEIVSGGGTATGTRVLGGGFQEVIDGTASGTTVSNFGFQRVSGTITGLGIAVSTTVLSGGVQRVEADGVVSNTQVQSGGIQAVSGGTASGTTVFSGGLDDIGSGGDEHGSILRGGSTERVFAGGKAVGTTISLGGLLDIFGGGADTNPTLAAAGAVDVFAGGTLTVSNPLLLQGSVIDDGTVVLAPTVAAAFQAPLSGAGTLVITNKSVTINQPEPNFTGTGEITGGSTLEFSSGVNFPHVLFAGDGTLKLDNPGSFTGVLLGFAAGDRVDLAGLSFSASNSATLLANNVLHLNVGGVTDDFDFDPNQDFFGRSFQLAPDPNGGTVVSLQAPHGWAPASTLSDFGGAQGWGSLAFTRTLVSDTVQHDTVYVGFGAVGTVMAWGVPNAVAPRFDEFGAQSVAVQDFGTNQGYDSSRERGLAVYGTGFSNGVAFQQNIVYGQGDAGIYLYRALAAAPQPDGVVVPSYGTTPELFSDFGRNEGWDQHFNFQTAVTTHATPDIVGFGFGGMIVAPQAFAPGASPAQEYFAANSAAIGNAAGWDSLTDLRTILDQNGKPIDLNSDGIPDFVGMGPQGLAFALGAKDGNRNFQLGAVQTAHINGASGDLGDPQGWNNATTPRLVGDINGDGRPDIVAFGAPGVFVSLGEDPATHGGEPFGQLYLGIADFGLNQGWSVAATPRFLADVNGDGIADIVGFGANTTFTALGSADASGRVTWAADPNGSIGDFGYQQGWDNSTFRGIADVSGRGHADLVLSGAFNTQVWHFNN